MEFWDRVAEAVKSQRTTFRWIAQRLEVAETTVSSWRRLNTLPRADHAYAIAEALGSTVEYLVTGQAPKGQSYRHLGPNATTILESIQTIPDDELKDMALLAKAKADAAAIDPLADSFGSGRQSAARSG